MKRPSEPIFIPHRLRHLLLRKTGVLLALMLLAVGLAMVVLSPRAAAADDEAGSATPETPLGLEEQKLLQQLAARLRIENELLKKENQQLRRLLLNRGAPTNAVSARVAEAVPGPGGTGDPEKPFWLSVGGKRHNATCRYFMKTTGKPCNAQEGTACKICGG